MPPPAITAPDRRTTMTEPGSIVVLLDTSPASEAALSAAARIARFRGRELVGLFIEERDLIRSAAYPFAREISFLSGTSRPFDSEMLRGRLDWQRRRIERRLAEEAARHNLSWRLLVESGSAVEVLAASGLNAELLLLGKAGWSRGRGGRLGSTATALIGSWSAPLVLWEGTPPPGGGAVSALITDNAAAASILAVADTLAAAADRSLHLLLAPGVDPAVERALLDARREKPTATTVEHPDSNRLTSLARSLRRRPPGELVIGRSAARAFDCRLEELLVLGEDPVVVVPNGEHPD
jgi:nucleotide-binding universal stress UspA family protein